jgi:hypothetical protein
VPALLSAPCASGSDRVAVRRPAHHLEVVTAEVQVANLLFMHDMTGSGIRDRLIALSVVRTLTHPVLPRIPVVESAAVGMIVCQMNWCET